MVSDVGPVLSDRSLRYKRNCLILSVAAILGSLIPGAAIEKAAVLKLTLDSHIWWVGAVLLIYNLAWFAIIARQDFVSWDQKTKTVNNHIRYAGTFRFLGISISKAFRPKNFIRAITARAETERPGGAAAWRSAGQYVAFLLFEVIVACLLAIIALYIAVEKTWLFFG